jgi:uncharacterized membrane protein
MWGTILTKAGELFLTYFIVPLFSKLVVIVVKYFQDKKEEADRNAKVDDAVKHYEEAKTAQERKDAFKNLIRSRSS